jgi:hypothetical protein
VAPIFICLWPENMDQPKVVEHTWIKIYAGEHQPGIDAYVLRVGSDGLAIGYHQDGGKAVRDDVVWNGSGWQFQYSEPSSSYLHGQDEMIVKKGPHRPT